MVRILDKINLPEALKGKPLTAVDIDNHNDCNNIWATLLQVRFDVQEVVRSAYERGLEEGDNKNGR